MKGRGEPLKIAAVCITWQEPRLGRVIESFLRQSHSDRELIVLSDDGWYWDQPHGDDWKIISFQRRFNSLGSKRNAATALTSPDVEAFAVCDSDDLYLPHWLAAINHALQGAAWCQPRQVLEWNPDGTWRRQQTWRDSPINCAYHGAWGYTREAFEAVNGYPIAGEEDMPLVRKLLAKFGPSADTICDAFPDPYYAYSRGPEHISEVYSRLAKETPDYHREAYRLKGLDRKPPEPLVIGWERDFSAIPIPAQVHPRPW